MPDQHVKNVECRKEVRRVLAMRPGIALSAAAIAQRGEGGFAEDAVKAACAFLLSRQHITQAHDPDGGSEAYYQITAEGILAYERGH